MLHRWGRFVDHPRAVFSPSDQTIAQQHASYDVPHKPHINSKNRHKSIRINVPYDFFSSLARFSAKCRIMRIFNNADALHYKGEFQTTRFNPACMAPRLGFDPQCPSYVISMNFYSLGRRPRGASARLNATTLGSNPRCTHQYRPVPHKTQALASLRQKQKKATQVEVALSCGSTCMPCFLANLLNPSTGSVMCEGRIKLWFNVYAVFFGQPIEPPPQRGHTNTITCIRCLKTVADR